jgi:pimeloyl-ACP methyl ester carboxylesterase
MNPGQISRRQVISMGAGLVACTGIARPLPISTREQKATFVLVHGAWHGGWCWRRVSDRLAARGHYVVAPTLSGLCERSHLPPNGIGLSTHIEDVAGEIKWKDLDGIVLVGHSYGGMVITGVAEQLANRIAAIVYLDAFMPADGESLYAIVHAAPPQASAVQPHPAEYFHVNAKDQAWVDSKLTPQPTRTLTEGLRVTDACQRIHTKLYVRAPLFQMAAFDNALDRCRADRSWRTETVTCGHDVMIDQPEVLAEMLEKLV